MSTPRFVISSFCHTSGCVAVAALPDGAVIVRDSKSEDSPALEFTAQEWAAFVAGVKNAEFDFADPA